MIHKGITNSESNSNKIKLTKKLRASSVMFIITAFLPFIIILLFAFNILKGKPAESLKLEEPIAKVIVNNGIGTAFLVSPTQLLTARHVVEGMNIGDEVILDFQKARKPRQITGRIVFYESSNSSPVQGVVPLGYFLTDIAVIEIPEIEDIEPMEIGDSDFVEELDEVILIGYPNDDYSKTDGKINSISYQDLDLFKSDVTANRGNSGGPAIYKEDKSVIGIIVGSGDPDDQGENVIIKINNAIWFLENNGIIIQ